MFLDQIEDFTLIAPKISCAIFSLPNLADIHLPGAFYLTPDSTKKTTVITIESLRDFLAFTHNIETVERFFVISPADAMNDSAQNAFLKNLEEPKPHCHFILLTNQPGLLLPTIRSRAPHFILRQTNTLSESPKYPQEILDHAKALISATPLDLPNLADDITRKKAQSRHHAICVTSAAIEILYKTYLRNQNPKFLSKLPKFLTLLDHLHQNCHVKLHIIADLC